MSTIIFHAWSANRNLPTCLVLLCTGLLLSSLHYCSARDNITAGNPISSRGNETLISISSRFELGFFTNNRSVYVGIWYHLRDPRTYVWVANRDKPLPDFSSGSFRIADGYLTLSDENETSFFSVSVGSSSSSPRTVRLLDSGNLVATDESGKISWESFNTSTDTFLPGMKMDENLKLTSWSSEDDPRRGNFTFQQDGENGYMILKSGRPYWKSSQTVSFKPDPLYDRVALLLSNAIPDSPRNANFFRRNLNNVRLLMNSSGKVQYYTWDNKKGWSLIWSEPQDSCSVYMACGNFGVCNSKNRVLCKCLFGFEPQSLDDWSGGDFASGCKRKSDTCAKGSQTFLDLKMMKVGIPDSPYPDLDDEEKCRKECLRCSCQAYSYNYNYSSRGCWIWNSNSISLQEEYEHGYNISVRVAASSIGSTARECKICGANVIPYPLSTGENCGDPMYFNFLCNSSMGQVNFQTQDGTFRVTSITPETRKFVIEVNKSIGHCHARKSVDEESLQLGPSSPFKVVCYPEPGSTSSEMRQRNMDEVEFEWDIPPEPVCNSDAECKDWPNSSCNATVGVTGRCQCNRNYVWYGENIRCTKGSNPKQPEGAVQFREPEKKTTSISSEIAVIVVLVVFTASLLCIIIFFFYRRRMAANRQGSRQGSRALQRYDTERRVKNFIDSSEFKEDDKKGIDVPFFDFESILEATDYFSDANKLGQGGFGPVYKGKFSGGQEIAVKRLSSHSGQGLQEFKNEVVLIAKLQHRNLVRLLGYCIKGDERILLYEYMPNKSLDAFIFDGTQCLSLDWEKRLDIILGIARGLLYLHRDSRLRIIHRDLKTSNILLDEEMNPKISDFGLAKIVRGKETEANTNRIMGTYGYMSPEYALEGLFSVKSDVFSFGVIVLEIVSGKKNTGFYPSQQGMKLLGYAWRLWKEEKAMDLMDLTLLESCNRGEVLRCIIVGLLCVQEDPTDRPNMSNVLFMLGSENATLPNPKEPTLVAKKWNSSGPSSSSKPETCFLDELTVSSEEA
ncbi:G-type lectin S-receptor-like serine/threonine-protein kinase At4g03230 isoform X2 [Actinidia eriantha]|uniref:G-type lectin S-receptor-like serine/threonine-protein kinase At4g03230 isoform X2 n=1 Tax=Actinidia eriantha TaxID=165200 RepID=UPI002590D813|nr:G-type lectin S-receptor-like serine/threonine-protein kinase At4g03230 isoform X2 [Actinidia eriantha]